MFDRCWLCAFRLLPSSRQTINLCFPHIVRSLHQSAQQLHRHWSLLNQPRNRHRNQQPTQRIILRLILLLCLRGIRLNIQHLDPQLSPRKSPRISPLRNRQKRRPRSLLLSLAAGPRNNLLAFLLFSIRRRPNRLSTVTLTPNQTKSLYFTCLPALRANV